MQASKKIGLLVGILAFFVFLFIDNLDPTRPQLNIMAAIAILMAIFWISEAIPLAVTSLIPLILFPLTEILPAEDISTSYMNSIIFLFLGGFLIAIAMEEWSLHKRIALKIISIFGGTPRSIIFGFMASGALLSMWISNTATALMLLPIGLSVISKLENSFGTYKTQKFSMILMLSIAYSCTLGGVVTLIGTPPNLVMVKMLNVLFPEAPELTFGNWMLLALPISLLMLCLVAIILTKVIYKIDRELELDKNFIREEYNQLGKLSYEEKFISFIFMVTALLWIFRGDIFFGFIIVPGWSNLLPAPEFIDDGTIAISMAFILFLIPSKTKKRNLLDHTAFSKVPWGIILLFGGGFALAKGFTSTGLSVFIGEQLKSLQNISPLLIIILSAFVVSFLTELTSNTAVAQMILPVAASVSVAIGINPLLLMITVTISASMAFMLPVATPPNTIIFAGGKIKTIEMARTGFVLNILGVLIVSLIVYFVGTYIFNLDIFPAWANP